MSINKKHEIIFIIYIEYDLYAMNNKSADSMQWFIVINLQ
jgi:hypothetical protein